MKSAPISPEAVAARLAPLGFSIPDDALIGLAAYLGLLMKWNKAMNLVGTRSWPETLETLVTDSFHLANFLPRTGLTSPTNGAPSQNKTTPLDTLDLGAGAGLPGIPLRLLWREGRYTLIEVREKRALFMKTALAACDAGNTRVFHGRAEEYFATSPPADCIISRAFMPWRDLLAFVHGALAPGGRIIFLALTPTPEDLPEGWSAIAETAYSIGNKTRYLWCAGKEDA
ncbi:MAG: Ribosomal RNA small subunit methyltransferase G [Desulfovibrio sp.]